MGTNDDRLAAHRAALLASGALTAAELCALRGDDSPDSTRSAMARLTHEHRIFSVEHRGETLWPLFQLDEAGRPRTELASLLVVLMDEVAGPWEERSWQMWTWLTSPTGLLSGDVPAEVAQHDPERAANAARRFIARVVPASERTD